MAQANRANVEVKDPLEWWVIYAADYLILFKIVFDLFSYLVISAKCKWVFLQIKKVIINECNCL